MAPTSIDWSEHLKQIYPFVCCKPDRCTILRVNMRIFVEPPAEASLAAVAAVALVAAKTRREFIARACAAAVGRAL